MNHITAQNLSFSYGQGKEIIRDLSFELMPGKLTFLLGANGAGKSTLLKLLCGLLKPSGGSVGIDGRDLTGFSALQRARTIAVMLQQAVPALDFTVEELVLFGRSAKLPRLSPPRDEDREAVLQALRCVGMLSFAGRRANTLSGGEFQRVFLAAALALDSGIIFLDEPVSAQDPAQSVQIFDMLRELACTKTLLVISHDLGTAVQFGSRLLLLAEGSLLADGAPQEVLTSENLLKLYNTPAHSPAARLLTGMFR